MITLAIEASTYSGSVAVLRGEELVGATQVAMRGRDHEALMPAVATLLGDIGATARDLGRVVCGEGPGAFTSLRVAGSIAKGLCMASGASLVPISSLALVVASRQTQRAERCLVVSDAMRGESYVQLFEADHAGGVTALGPVVLRATSEVDSIAREQDARAIGPQRAGDDLVIARASAVARLTALLAATDPAVLAVWEPGYGRLAEAQVKWEATHGRALGSA